MLELLPVRKWEKKIDRISIEELYKCKSVVCNVGILKHFASSGIETISAQNL